LNPKEAKKFSNPPFRNS